MRDFFVMMSQLAVTLMTVHDIWIPLLVTFRLQESISLYISIN